MNACAECGAEADLLAMLTRCCAVCGSDEVPEAPENRTS